MNSNKYRFNLLNIKRAGKVLAWSLLAVLAVEVVNLIGQFDMPLEYALFVPVANSILYAIKDFAQEQAE